MNPEHSKHVRAIARMQGVVIDELLAEQRADEADQTLSGYEIQRRHNAIAQAATVVLVLTYEPGIDHDTMRSISALLPEGFPWPALLSLTAEKHATSGGEYGDVLMAIGFASEMVAP